MARNERGDEPLNEEDYEVVRERLNRHFEKVRELMEEKLEESDASE